MKSKNINFRLEKQTFLFLLISLSLIEIKSCLSLSRLSIEKACSNSDKYINNFFNGNGKLPKNYIELDKTEIEKGNNKNIIKLILLSENTKKNNEESNISKQRIYKIILLIIIIFFCISIIFFEIHFLYRIPCGNIDKIKEKTATYSTFFKIHPFGIFKYSFMDQKERDKYFIEYKSQKKFYNKNLVIFQSIIVIILMIGSILLTLLNILDSKTKKTVDNMTCSLMKFLYEIKNKPIRQSSFIGFENVNNFFVNASEKLKEINLKLPVLQNNLNECKTQNINWMSSINSIQKKLLDINSMEFYIYNLPSDPRNMNFQNFSLMGDISKAKKHLFQLEVIYDYYPAGTEGKSLYYINNNFSDISNPVVNEVKKLEKKLSLDEKNDIYQNIVSKINNILDLYIKKFQEVYMEKINKDLINDLTHIYNSDFISLLLLILCFPFFIMLIKSICNKNYYSFNKLVSALLMNFIFIFFILSIYQLIILHKINKKVTYIEDIWSGIAFLFDSNNSNYLNEHPINNIEDIDLLINETNKYNNLFYYLNYMVNNKGKLSGNPELQIGPFTNAELSEIDKIFNNLTNFLNSYDNNNPNIYLYNNSKKISDMIEGGLKYDTNFKDISGTGYLGNYLENAITYLTYVNLRTRNNTRTNWGFEDFDCDETWNISTKDYSFWTYTNSEKYLCDNCTNHYSPKNADIPPLLNFLEFTLEQAIQRYSDLKNTKNNAEYNGIVYYLTATEFLRNSSFIKQLEKINDFNMELTEIQKKNFALLKQAVNSAKGIINDYLNIFNFIGNRENITSIIYCGYLKEDLNFVLGEVKDGFLKKINNMLKFHKLMDFINIILSIFMIVFYCLISYNLPYFLIENDETQKIKQQNASSIQKIINDKKIDVSIISHQTISNNDQIIPKTAKNSSKDINNEILKIKIDNNFNPQMNNSINLANSKANIIGELQNNDGLLNLNEKKNKI